MSDKSPIEWLATRQPDGTVTAGASWNPTRGCARVSDGCKHCYAERVAARFSGPGQPYEGLIDHTSQGPKWNGTVRLAVDQLTQPLHWKRPRRIFVDSMSDVFHKDVPDWFIDQVFAVMMLRPDHTFLLLTKRADRMQRYLTNREESGAAAPFTAVNRIQLSAIDYLKNGAFKIGGFGPIYLEEQRQHRDRMHPLPLPNVHLGVSIENQPTANERLPLLARTPAAVRIASAEPLLGRINLERALEGVSMEPGSKPLDGVIAGGESGPGARPMHPLHAKSLRDQCEAMGLDFFFKQWGEWCPADSPGVNPMRRFELDALQHACHDGSFAPTMLKGMPIIVRAGKKDAGRVLDGRTHDAMPGA